ncbi:hypothetical protein [Thalassobaculum sp.]|uniref:hypothetical protein n=1 Tax=Thalassobaculum sp. TaxID=2022740 RepID=UPI0032EF1D72
MTLIDIPAIGRAIAEMVRVLRPGRAGGTQPTGPVLPGHGMGKARRLSVGALTPPARPRATTKRSAPRSGRNRRAPGRPAGRGGPPGRSRPPGRTGRC